MNNDEQVATSTITVFFFFVFFCFFFRLHIHSDCSRGLLRGTAPCHLGILPEHLNRGHTEGSPPSHPPAVLGWFLLREDTAISSHCVHTPNKFMLYTALSTGKNESERKNSNFYFWEKDANAGTRTHDLPLRRLRGYQLDHRGDRMRGFDCFNAKQMHKCRREYI